ncbi:MULTISPECIES: cation:proton antiporter [unclassified Mycolicibacterium]|uniref:cation:proton antiporter n=1 Tax=unclassified Mycolicibacterium TaxID=2636767 RepID=UPI0012DD4A5E|nr:MULTISPECIES: cation:proton antiporter [unclassified Mycolicibacterium]MUL84213.1 cation:proton antiporter [Mycolicibacterium sp. CBMA 329]MUL89721.1 cation:proton antiporter [Mycolicibacterium sp. CBMA 331]MUL99896.1 cation:proton antiporter [Mycolicibacterium sp. CBMA 334]MUM27050.1 cation:proton antiporter [Mycolicibacterium sp. CBMA 295]MUM39236.1 cation:proton antiporter [Mycolicibacterium sp. CBMA 247]
MAGFGFDTLALVAVIGLTGPALASVPRLRLPVVIGELIVGIVVGRTGFGLVDHTDPTFALLANIGFALVMFVAGTHVPVRDTALRKDIPKAMVRALLVGAVAAVLGVVTAHVFGTGHAALYAVVMASSSAALALPVIDGLRLRGPNVLSVTAQIAIADAASIVLLPLVIDIQRAPRAALGALAIAGCAVVLFFVLRAANARGLQKRLHRYSEDHKFALELRISLIMLFGLAALAIATHVSIMLAGFALGLVVSAIGEPRRLARQLFGVTEGFFGPLFFVWLGASLQVRELADKPEFIGLGVVLGLGAVLAHAAGRLLGQPLTLAVFSAAQLGVPVAAATLGTEQHLLAAGEPAALILGALLTIATTSIAGALAARRAAQLIPRK